jgi:plastocyanin
MTRILVVLGMMLMLVSGAAATGVLGGTDSGPASAAAARRGAGASVIIQAFAFKPARLRVRVGGRVTWTNLDSAPHTATADRGRAFDTGTLGRGQSRTVTFRRRGTFSYHCTIHPFMVATVTVG